MNFSRFREEIILPFVSSEKEKVDQVRNALTDMKSFTQFIDTPDTAFAKELEIRLNAASKDILGMEKTSKVGALVYTLDCSGVQLDLRQLSSFVSKVDRWVRASLVRCEVQEWIGYMYPVLLISESNPYLTKQMLEDDHELMAKLIPKIATPGARLDLNYLSKMISEDLGALETDSYRFWLHGALIYDSNYLVNRDYVQRYVLPTVARRRTIQAFFEFINRQLTERLEKPVGGDLGKSFDELAMLRETSLRAFASAEQSRSFRQLTEMADVLDGMFGLDGLRSSLDDKIDVLNSILSRLTEARARRVDQRMSYANLLLTASGFFLAVLALPQVYSWLVQIFSWLLKLISGS